MGQLAALAVPLLTKAAAAVGPKIAGALGGAGGMTGAGAGGMFSLASKLPAGFSALMPGMTGVGTGQAPGLLSKLLPSMMEQLPGVAGGMLKGLGGGGQTPQIQAPSMQPGQTAPPPPPLSLPTSPMRTPGLPQMPQMGGQGLMPGMGMAGGGWPVPKQPEQQPQIDPATLIAFLQSLQTQNMQR